MPGLEYLFGQGKYIQSGIPGLEYLFGQGKYSVWNTWIRKLVQTRIIFSLEYLDQKTCLDKVNLFSLEYLDQKTCLDKVNIQSGIPGLENLFGQGKYQSGIPGLENLFGQGKYSVWNTWIRKLVWTW